MSVFASMMILSVPTNARRMRNFDALGTWWSSAFSTMMDALTGTSFKIAAF
jgi:hypothetical protein